MNVHLDVIYSMLTLCATENYFLFVGTILQSYYMDVRLKLLFYVES